MNIWEKIANIPNEIKYMAWLIVVSIIGGMIGFVTKTKPHGRSRKEMVYVIIFTIVSSMFISYLTFEIVNAFINKPRLSIAIAGLAAYSGTDLLILLQDTFVNKIKDKIDKI